MAEMSAQPPFAVGIGYDVHAFKEGRRLVLGGVEIPSSRGLDGHSDADVLLHAVCDALLGGAALPDIGHFFPNTDPKWKDADSRLLLRETVGHLKLENWKIGNIDAVLIAETPRIKPYVEAMKENIAADAELSPTRIGIKATTNEKMGFVGREEGIAAIANVILYR